MTQHPKLVFWVFAIVAVFACFYFFAGMSGLYVSGKWRYKMTVSVETPEGLKTGYAVREVSNSTSSLYPDWPNATNPAKVRGEAVVVDLGERGTLFALISDQSAEEFYNAFPVDGPTTAQGIRYYNSLKPGKKAELTQYPMLVTFEDLNDPESVQRVDYNDLAKTFGAGIKLAEVTVEMTKEPVTKGIDKWLPWLNGMNANIDGATITTGKSLANILHVGRFKRGDQ